VTITQYTNPDYNQISTTKYPKRYKSTPTYLTI